MADIAKQKPFKGGRKGGAYFPKIDLKKAVDYNKKLVSKTHTAPQPDSIILPGVFNNNGPDGIVRASALRQFGLLNEDKTKMEALELGKEIAASPEDEVQPLLQKACLSPKIFNKLYETFKGDKVNVGKLKQQAIKLNVHPDSADDCVQIFIKSLEFAGLGQVQDDGFQIHNGIVTTSKGKEPSETDELEDTEDPLMSSSPKNDQEEESLKDESPSHISRRQPSSSVQVNISLDSTMDTEKLEKLLKLLKNYGAI